MRGDLVSPGEERLDAPTLIESMLDFLPKFNGSGGRVALRNGLSTLRLSFGGRREPAPEIESEGRF